uniref:Uncharacterized protein n=1 Tax=Utricularia reniformis TaxID=192314 RepID=A0A1Y0B101_9LAMI|nr:hypothetical protein AEK19_MT0805 [Utricularia reniformis]ART31043.1 hypothetical protein AEK19_MT0805 [Utricularia reniformis]
MLASFSLALGPVTVLASAEPPTQHLVFILVC